jgi:uncharacterized protein (TIGR02246 family)
MRIAITAVIVFLLGAQTPTAQDDAGDAAVRARIKALEAAWNARDAAGVASAYAPDGDLILGDGPRHSGRDAIRRSSAAMWSGVPPERRISISVDAIRHVGPDTAIAECTARFSAGEPAQDRATWVMVRRQGSWWVAALRVMPAERSPK